MDTEGAISQPMQNTYTTKRRGLVFLLDEFRQRTDSVTLEVGLRVQLPLGPCIFEHLRSKFFGSTKKNLILENLSPLRSAHFWLI